MTRRELFFKAIRREIDGYVPYEFLLTPPKLEEIIKKEVEMGCDVLMLGDDVSNQRDMMMSLELWRKFHKPRLARLINTAKSMKPDIPIYFHSDGNPEKIIPELIEIGVDILNPVQPECIDPVRMKELYGGRLSFWGILGTQTTMPFGTPEEVKRVCNEWLWNWDYLPITA